MYNVILEYKKNNPIEQVASLNTTLVSKGNALWGLCPFHGEDTPSFKVDVKRQRYKCFGCGEGGDVIRYISKMRGISDKELIGEILSKNKDKKVTKKKKIQSRYDWIVANLIPTLSRMWRILYNIVSIKAVVNTDVEKFKETISSINRYERKLLLVQRSNYKKIHLDKEMDIISSSSRQFRENLIYALTFKMNNAKIVNNEN